MGSSSRGIVRLVRVLGVAALVLGFTGQGPAMGGEPTPDMLPPGDWTEAQEAELLDLIDRTEAALPAFSDIETIEGMGFENFGATAPGGYDHYTNQAWVDDDVFIDPEHPESLVFQRSFDPATGEVTNQLVSAMYMLPSDYGMEDIPTDIAWLPGWHVHKSVCADEAGQFSGLAGADGTCAQGSPLLKPPMMHVWIVDEPCDHRFGGIGISGAHCDVTGHHGDPEEPETDPGATDPGLGAEDPGGGNDQPDTDAAPSADAATPVEGQPTFTG